MRDNPLEIILVCGGIILLVGLFVFVEVEEAPQEPESLFEPVQVKQISAAPTFFFATPANSFQVKTYKDWGYQPPAKGVKYAE